MKNTKRIIMIALAMVMGLSTALTGCAKKSGEPEAGKSKEIAGLNKTGYPIVKEKVNLKMAASRRSDVKDFNELKFFKQLEEKTNVHIDWISIPDEGWKEKLGLMFAGNDLPDAFFGNWALTDNDVVKYSSQGMLAPIDKLIDEYAPNIKKHLSDNPDYKKLLTTPDGKIYSLPVIDESYFHTSDALFINKNWLDKVGMKAPTTPDELYNVLKAFKGKDLNGNGKDDEIPMSFRFNDGQRGLYSMFGAFGLLDARDHIAMDGDKVIFTANRPEYKEAIKYFNKLFSEGLIDQESFTHDNKVMVSKQQSKPAFLGATLAWSRTAFSPAINDSEFIAIEPLKGPKGQLWNRVPFGLRGKGAFTITSSNKNPEVTMRWIDQMYDSKTSYESNQGLIGELLKENPDGTIETLKLDQKLVDQYKANIPGASTISAISKEFAGKIVPPASMIEKRAIDELYKPFFPKTIYPLVFFSQEETEKLATLNTDIINYVDQMYAKWMLKGGIDQEWDEYTKKLKQMGVDELVKIKQAAYDRYKNAK